MKKAFVFGAMMMAGAEAARTKTKAEVLKEQLQNFNRGTMKAMQANPDDTTSDCYTTTTLVNDEIAELFNFDTYASGTFSLAGFQDRYNVMSVFISQQYEACMVTEYTMKWD